MKRLLALWCRLVSGHRPVNGIGQRGRRMGIVTYCRRCETTLG